MKVAGKTSGLEGAQFRDQTEDFVLVACSADASVVAAFEAGVLRVESVGQDLSWWREGFPQERRRGNFNPEKSMVRWSGPVVVEGTAAPLENLDPRGHPESVDGGAGVVAVVSRG